MTRIKAKICGLSTAETVDAAVRHCAAAVGFVFFPPSPRAVSFEQAAALAARVPPGVLRVGVFVEPCNALIDQAVAAARLDVVQLHKCPPNRAAALRQHSGREVWAALPVKTGGDLAAAAGYRDAADRLLYDAKTPEGAALPGGMGLRFDWKLLAGFSQPLPWLLSGGLDAGNAGEAIRTTGADFVDVSSGVETAPGVKDVDRIAAFLKAVAAS